MKPIKLSVASKRPPRPVKGEVLSYLGATMRYINGEPVRVGDVVDLSGGGETVTITGGNPPHKSSSSGFVWVEDSEGRTREYYPTIIAAKWEWDS